MEFEHVASETSWTSSIRTTNALQNTKAHTVFFTYTDTPGHLNNATEFFGNPFIANRRDNSERQLKNSSLTMCRRRSTSYFQLFTQDSHRGNAALSQKHNHHVKYLRK